MNRASVLRPRHLRVCLGNVSGVAPSSCGGASASAFFARVGLPPVFYSSSLQPKGRRDNVLFSSLDFAPY